MYIIVIKRFTHPIRPSSLRRQNREIHNPSYSPEKKLIEFKIDKFVEAICKSTFFELLNYIYVAEKNNFQYSFYHEFSIFSKIEDGLENIQEIFIFVNLIYQLP